MKRITLEGGAKVVIFDLPPENFDPLTASAAELERYGFPDIANDPHHRERYQKLFSQLKRKLKFVEPTFRAIPAKTKASGPFGLPGTSPNWSGSVISPPQGQSIKWVQGQWVVPNIVAPGSGSSPACNSWVGIDGDRANDMLIAGVASGLMDGKKFFRLFWLWTQTTMVGVDANELTSVEVNNGDLITAVICSTQGAGSTSATVYFVNLTTGLSTHFGVSAVGTAAAETLVGNSAEWVVSADLGPIGFSPNYQLADYGKVLFNNCEAGMASNGNVLEGGTGNALNMTAGGQVVSRGILIGPTTVECLYGAGTAPPPPPPESTICEQLAQNIRKVIIDNGPAFTVAAWPGIRSQLEQCVRQGYLTQATVNALITEYENWLKTRFGS
jgi:hypothetical protein